MATKLNTITTQYHSYTVDQVLTHYQLNETIDYFEDQDRLSRVFLLGTGIACGFKVSLNATKDAITITQGNGITTDGDLIKLVKDSDNIEEKTRTKQKLSKIDFSSITYKSYTTFTDSFAKYKPFRNGDTIIPIHEILPEKTNGSPSLEANQFLLSQITDIENFVVVIYLENHRKEAAKCSGIDCDNQGIEEVNNIRILLIRQSDVDSYVNHNDVIWKEFNQDDTDLNNLPEIRLKRVMLNKINNSSDLNKAYNKIIVSQSEELRKAILQFLNISPNLISGSIRTEINNLFTVFFPDRSDAQYKYDLLKDLIDTYQEIKELVNHTNVLCNPDINAFPKHLLLGHVKPSTSETDLYRHSFYKSHILSDDIENSSRINYLFSRMVYMLKEFDSRVSKDTIEITPSKLNVELGKKAIPVYYNLPKRLIHYWDYDKTVAFKEKNNLSYHKSLLSNDLHIQDPLSYNLEPFNFFRVEDTHGKDYKTVLSEIEEIRLTKGLNFDVKCLSIDLKLDDIDLKDFDCQFKDLQMHLSSWKIEQDCLYKEAIEFLSGFSIKENGGHNYFDKLPKKIIDKSSRISSPITKEIASALISRVETISKEETKTPITKKIVFQEAFTPIENNTQSIQPIKGLIEFEASILDDTEDLGSLMTEVLNIKYPLSESDYISLLKAEIDKKILDYNQWTKPDKELRVDTPLRIVASIKALSLYIPTTIDQVNETLLSNYTTALTNLCNLVKKSFNTINSNINNTVDKYTKLGFEESYLNLISRLKENCCSADYLKTLFQETIDRKKKILDSLLFENYVKKHPGMEHLCGVPNGGTFILVFEGGKIRSGNSVIADFSLPYLCCSDCVPVNFILESVVMLSLKKNTVCFDVENLENSDVYFEVTPPDAEITIINSPAGVDIKDGKISFTSEFKTFSTPLEFLVNGKSVSTKLTVTKKPTLEILYSFDNKTNTVTLESSIESITNNYTWDVNETTLEKTKKVSFVQTKSESITVNLTLDSGLCGELTTSITKEIEITLSLEIVPEYCFDAKSDEIVSIPFLVSPTNSLVTLSKEYPGLGIFANGITLQNNFDFFGQPIHFLINGEETTSTITINKKPDLEIITKFDSNKKLLSIESNTTSEDGKYTWTINGKSETNKEQSFIIPVSKSTLFNISLGIKKGICGQLSAQKSLNINVAVGLTIEPKHCFNNEQFAIPYTVIPSDGVLSLSQDVLGISIEVDKVIIKKNFSAFNTPIAFKVNDEDVTQTITIQRRPNTIVINSNYNSTSQVLTLSTPTTVFDAKYEWFIDDISIGNDKNLTKIMELSPGTHLIKLTIDTGVCGLISTSSELIVEKIIESNPPSFKLDTNEICFNKTIAAIGFNVSPLDASIKLKNNDTGVSIKNKNLVFGTSYDSFNKPNDITFIVNGVDFTETITVNNNLLADITENFDFDKKSIELTSSLISSNNEYNWTIDDKAIDKKDITIVVEIPKNSLTGSKELIDIFLTFDGNCGKSEVSKKMPVCFLLSDSYLKRDELTLQKLIEKDSSPLEIYATNEGFKIVTEFFQNYKQVFTSYLSGDKNQNLNLLAQFLGVLSNDILNSDTDNTKLMLIQWYKIVLKLILNIIRCQEDDKLSNFLEEFSNRIDKQMTSFKENDININTASFQKFFAEYLFERDDKSKLYLLIQLILSSIKN